MHRGLITVKRAFSSKSNEKDPGLAGFLNIIFPGLGCAYLGKLLYAIGYLVWVPLAFIAASMLSDFVAAGIHQYVTNPIIVIVVKWVLLLLLRTIVLWDVFFTPYRLAEERNNILEDLSEKIAG